MFKLSSPSAVPRQVYSVLVVEDHADTLVMLRTILEMFNFKVLEACDGDMALRVATENIPDLILMDTGLPSTDGVSATRLIRENENMTKVPIIFLSGHALPSQRQKALEAGGNEYLIKPINIEELLTIIAKCLSPKSELSN